MTVYNEGPIHGRAEVWALAKLPQLISFDC